MRNRGARRPGKAPAARGDGRRCGAARTGGGSGAPVPETAPGCPLSGAASGAPPGAEAAEVFDIPSLPPRRRDSHKGTFGHLLIVAGSRGMAGAACLAAMGALRGGAGLVTVAVPEPIWDIVAGRIPDALTAGLPAGKSGAISREAADAVLELCRGRDALVIGPGISADPDAREAAARIAVGAPLPSVLDADALNAMAGRCRDIGSRPPASDGSGGAEAAVPARVLTPHPGEMARLLSLTAEEVQRDRVGSAISAARFGRCVAVLKGYKSVVSDGAKFFANRTGGPGMARGGSGDVLAGLIGALLAQGLDVFDAACLGVYLHGLAGETAAAELTEEGMTASDIAAFLPKAWRKYREMGEGRRLRHPGG
ncbi:MAG: NAD(P)H-hydrate dehydratase [Planctomycetota bacterium]|nr:NAD(P)H-hydrate dehydratase [Planctomycetota bacterium]